MQCVTHPAFIVLFSILKRQNNGVIAMLNLGLRAWDSHTCVSPVTQTNIQRSAIFLSCFFLFFSETSRQFAVHRYRQQNTRRCKWTPQEKETVHRRFATFFLNQKLPGKRDIENVQQTEQVLHHRTWRNIKDFIRNSMKQTKWQIYVTVIGGFIFIRKQWIIWKKK